MKTTTKFAIAAIASALMGTSALAADLGGSCCADLEERIAELEATTVRKGNRKVSVQISGFVGHHVLWWDDGSQSDSYIGDGGNNFSRWRLRGSAKINPEVTAGFLYEFGVNNNAIGTMNQSNGNGPGPVATGAGGDELGECTNSCLRDSTVWLRHSRFGMVKIGHGSTATDNLVLIDLAARSDAGTPDVGLYVGGFVLRGNNGLFAGNTANANWNQAIRGHESWDTGRRNHVLYESPALHGFTLQAAVAEDNYWDVALRYAGEFNGVRVAFGIGYQEDTEFNAPFDGVLSGSSVLCNNNCNVKSTDLKGSASVLHVPTGLFLTAAAGRRELDGSNVSSNQDGTAYAGPDLTFWHLAGGVARNFFGIGSTVLFAEYSQSEGGLEQTGFLTNGANGYLANTVTTGRSSSEFTGWGIGVNQYVDAAAMQIFAVYRAFELDANGFVNQPSLNKGYGGVAELSTFMVGMRVDF